MDDTADGDPGNEQRRRTDRRRRRFSGVAVGVAVVAVVVAVAVAAVATSGDDDRAGIVNAVDPGIGITTTIAPPTSTSPATTAAPGTTAASGGVTPAGTRDGLRRDQRRWRKVCFSSFATCPGDVSVGQQSTSGVTEPRFRPVITDAFALGESLACFVGDLERCSTPWFAFIVDAPQPTRTFRVDIRAEFGCVFFGERTRVLEGIPLDNGTYFIQWVADSRRNTNICGGSQYAVTITPEDGPSIGWPSAVRRVTPVI